MSHQIQPLEGQVSAEGLKFALVASRFNHVIVEKLVGGAIDAIVRHCGSAEAITLVWVPGSWEIPLAVQRMAESKQYDAVIALGAVIRGGTPHFDYVAGEVSKGIAQVSLQTGVPVSMGVLTTDSLEQAIERAGSKMGNKGWDAACAAMEMANLLGSLPASGA